MAEGGKKLSEEQINETLKSLNVPFKKNELVSPTREFIVRVFECFLKDLQIDVSGPEFRAWEAFGHIEDGDMYEESQYLILLALLVNHITYPLRLDITVKDIVEPKPKRTKKILNYILVFWNYYLQKILRFHSIKESYEDDRKRAEELIEENQCLDEKYNDMYNRLQNTQPNKEELMNAVSARGEKLNKIEQQAAELMTEYNSLKTKASNIGTEIGATEVSIVTAKERLEELNQLILSSPDRLKTDIQRLKDKIKAEDAKIKEKETKLKDTEKKLQQQEESLKVDEKALSILNHIIEEVNSLRDSVKSIVVDQQKLEEEEDKLSKLQTDLQQQEDWEAHQKQKSLKISINTKKQTETYMALLETHQKDEVKEKRTFEFIKTAVDELQKRIVSETCSIKEIYNKSKEANTISQERIAQYTKWMERTTQNFKGECESLVQETKKKFPDISI